MRSTLTLALFILALAPAIAQERREGPEILSDGYLDRLSQELKLSDGQRKEIGGVLEKVRPDVKSQWEPLQEEEKRLRELRVGFEKALRSAHERVREKLNDEQKESFDRLRLRPGRVPGRQRVPGMRGIDVDPEDIPPAIRERMNRGPDFPPEMWEKPRESERREGLPPELREHIEKRLRDREAPQPGGSEAP